MTVQRRGIMKTCSRFIFALLILAAALSPMAVSAQETSAKQPATTTRQQSSIVQERRAPTKATETQRPNPERRLPPRGAAEQLPDRGRQRLDQYYPRMPKLIGVELLKAESTVRQIQP